MLTPPTTPPPCGTGLELGEHHLPQLMPLEVRYLVAATLTARRVADLCVGEERLLGGAPTELRAPLVV